jgi:hypothetical protein
MEQCIRHPDGTLLTSSEWVSIRATGRLVKAELLNLKSDPRNNKCARTKSYFRMFHPIEWANALNKMEQQQPLLALCSGQWKADHVLGNTLLVKSTSRLADVSLPRTMLVLVERMMRFPRNGQIVRLAQTATEKKAS